MKLVKSPFNYIGNKYKLLPEILPLMPENVNVFYDVFGGGFSVGINSTANKIVYNDIVPQVQEVLKELYQADIEQVILNMEQIVQEHNLSKENAEEFIAFRKYYNENPHWIYFYVLIQFSFNNQFRFNNSNQYNSSFGKHKSMFNDLTKQKLREYNQHLKDKQITFLNYSLFNFNFNQITAEDFVFFDPPYIISTGNYNDGKRGFEGWGAEHEQFLYTKIVELDKKGIRFGLTNLLQHKGIKNHFLEQLIKNNNFKVHTLNSKLVKSYNCKTENNSIEVYITNC